MANGGPSPTTLFAAALLGLGGAACGGLASDSMRAVVGGPAKVTSTSTSGAGAPVGEAEIPRAPDSAVARAPGPGLPSAIPAEPPSGRALPSAVQSENPFEALVVPGFPDAVLALPQEAEPRRPVVVVVHGLGDWPERHCQAWRLLTAARAFVVCPRGEPAPERSRPGDRRFTHASGAALRRHLDAALAALRERHGDVADTSAPLYAGFSLGATQLALLALAEPSHFPRIVILEGGLDVWFPATVRAFATGGGDRVLFGCGSAWCAPPARFAAAQLERAGLEAHVVVTGVGHTMDPPLQRGIAAELPWLGASAPEPVAALSLP